MMQRAELARRVVVKADAQHLYGCRRVAKNDGTEFRAPA
jgi:hypothetical protein